MWCSQLGLRWRGERWMFVRRRTLCLVLENLRDVVSIRDRSGGGRSSRVGGWLDGDSAVDDSGHTGRDNNGAQDWGGGRVHWDSWDADSGLGAVHWDGEGAGGSSGIGRAGGVGVGVDWDSWCAGGRDNWVGSHGSDSRPGWAVGDASGAGSNSNLLSGVHGDGS